MKFYKARNNVFLAPMAGVTDSAFRQIAVELGAGFTYTEMASANGIKYGSKKTQEIISPAPDEDFFGVQLFGSDPETISRSLETVFSEYPDRISVFDINMGCPTPKITGNGEGCALMNDMPLASSIIKAAVKISPVPVTVKFRGGWDEKNINAVEFALMAQDSGASAVTVHGRTRQQFYSGRSDITLIEKVKKAVNIPVIGNGDIFCAGDAAYMFEKTGCDGVMVARGALGNPFIFREINLLLKTGEEIKPASPEEKAEMLFRQAHLTLINKGERLAMLQIRKHAIWYFKGLKNAARIREATARLESLKDLKNIIMSVFPEISLN
jgi:tRNA-dihydrouridine synthase B